MFTTPEEVKDYANGDKIMCLECGEWFSMLSTHLRKHGFGEREYRMKYNIPNSIKLVGSAVRLKMRESNKTDHELLRERANRFRHLASGKSSPNKMFSQRLADMGMDVAAKAKTKLDESKVKEAHTVYMNSTQNDACTLLGVKPPTLHKWFDRLGLPKKCPPTAIAQVPRLK